MPILQHLLATVEGDWQLLREVMDIYFTDAPVQMDRIRQAIDHNDPLEVREAAHSLKGATGAFGKDNIVFSLAFSLEEMGQSGRLEHAEDRYQHLTKALTSMEQELKEGIAHQEGGQQ